MDLARTSRLACAAALGFAAIATVNESAARGTEMAAQLDYDAAPGCPSAGAFEAVVTGRLGYNPFRTQCSRAGDRANRARGTSSRRATRMAGCRGRMDRRADVSVANRRLRRARASDGIRARSADSADGDDRVGDSPARPPRLRRRRRRRAPTGRRRLARSTDRDQPGRPDEVQPRDAGAVDPGGRRWRGGTRCVVERHPARPPARNRRVVARRGRARGRDQRPVDDASG